MKKRVYINPAIYLVFIFALIGAIVFINQLLTTENYINIYQQIATYVMTFAMLFSVYWIGLKIKHPFPIYYDKNRIIIKRYFSKDIELLYEEIQAIEYYNRYDHLIVRTAHKKYKFNFLMGTIDLKKMLKKKVKNTNY